MRSISYAAVRAVFLYLLAPVALFLFICGLATPASGQESHSFDGTTLVLRGQAQMQVASIVYGPRVAVVIDPAHRYQWAHDEGDGYREGTRVSRDYYEITRSPLNSPAQHIGWRNPLRIEAYLVPVTYWTGPDLADGRAFIDVRASARGDFLIVVTIIHKPKGKGETP